MSEQSQLQMVEELLEVLCQMNVLDGTPDDYTAEAPSTFLPTPGELPASVRAEYEQLLAELESSVGEQVNEDG